MMAFTTGWQELTDGNHTKSIEKPDDICHRLFIIKKTEITHTRLMEKQITLASG